MLLREIHQRLGGELIGDGSVVLRGVGAIETAAHDQITFLANPKYRRSAETTSAGAVILSPQAQDATTRARIVIANPYAYFARVAQLFAPVTKFPAGIHQTAVIDSSARIASGASVGAFAVVGARANIGEEVRIGPHCIVGDDVTIGECTELVARVTVYKGCQIGARSIVHAGVVIGADGFGFARDDDAARSWVKIPQTGAVVIGADCEIGANTTIDRGAIENTRVGNGVKLDNQIQIGHNCTIGDHSIIAGCTGIAGSTHIGERVMIGGAVSITGHLSVCDDAVLSANAFVTKSITEPGMFSSGFPLMPHRDWLKNAAQLRRLDTIATRLDQLEKKSTSGDEI